MQRFRLSDRIQLAVNAASGNLLLSQRDVTIRGGMGPDLSLSRSYNSLRGSWGSFSGNWTWDTGNDYVLAWYPDAAVLYGPSGSEVRFTQNADGSYQSPAGFDDTLAYAGGGEFTLTDHSSQDKWTFGAGGRIVRMEDRNGRAISYTYNGLKATTITDNQGRETTISYTDPDDDALITEITDPAGRHYDYDYEWVAGQKLLSTYTDPNGGVTQYAYDSDHQLTQVTTPGGRITKIDYYTSGARAGKVLTITRVTDPATGTGPVTEFDYSTNRDGSGTGTVTDPNSESTGYTFDTSGRATDVKDALNRETKTTYTADSNVDTYRAPSDAGTDPTNTLHYDSANNFTGADTLTDASSTNANDKLHTHVDYGATWSGGSVAGADYLATSIQDEQDTAGGGATSTQVEYHNAQGDPSKISKAGGEIDLTYAPTSGSGASWDGNPGQVASTTDGDGHSTSYGYDTTGNLTSITPPTASGGTTLGQTTIFYAGAAGDDQALSRISEITDGNGNHTYFCYDSLDRVTKITITNTSDVETAHYDYSYDGDGNLTERDDVFPGPVIHTYSTVYDDLNRVTEEDLPGGASTLYGYDAASNLTSLTDSGGEVDYGYDAINRQKTIQEPGASTPISYTYTDNPAAAPGGQKIDMALPNGVTTTNLLDAGGRLASTTSAKSGANLQKLAYSYTDGTHQIALVSSVQDLVGGQTTDYGYDHLNRLTDATDHATGTPHYHYDYDNAGNLTQRTINGGTPETYRYNEDNELCWHYTGTSSATCASPPTGAQTEAYDAAGNQTTDDTHDLSYNEQNQLTSFDTIAFTYAGTGQAKRTSVGSTTVVNNLLGVASHTGGGNTDFYTRDENGAFVSERRPFASSPDQRLYPLADNIGSTRTLTDQTAPSLAATTTTPTATPRPPPAPDPTPPCGSPAANSTPPGCTTTANATTSRACSGGRNPIPCAMGSTSRRRTPSSTAPMTR